MTQFILRYIEHNIDEISLWHGGPAYNDLISFSLQFSDISSRFISSGFTNLSDNDLKDFVELYSKLVRHIAVCQLVGYCIDVPYPDC